MSDKPKIYAFIQGSCLGSLLLVQALAEDGEFLAGHASSNEWFARHDIGIGSDWKHDKYDAHYPGGWELEWIDVDVVRSRQHVGLEAAYTRHLTKYAPAKPAAEGRS